MTVRIPDARLDEARRTDCLALAGRLGVRLKTIATGEHAGPCPHCGGRDRFSVNTDKNVWNCRGCGEGGDAIALWRHCTGDSLADTVKALTGWNGDDDVSRSSPAASPSAGGLPAKGPDGQSASLDDGSSCASRPADAQRALAANTPKRDRASAPMRGRSPAEGDAAGDNPYRRKAQARAYRLWGEGAPAGDLIRGYFDRRGIPFPKWRLKTIRQMDRLAYWHDGEVIHSGPAMLAAITGADGKFIGVHRTWLDATQPGGKAVIADPKTGEVLASKKVLGSQRGGAIVLRGADFAEGWSCVLGEGIETVLSWDALHGAGEALWCGVNLDNIAGKAEGRIAHPTRKIETKRGPRVARVPSDVPDMGDDRCLVLPAQLETLILLGDGDSDPFTTRAAIRRAKARHGHGGRTVLTEFAPDGEDWNDVLRREKADRPSGPSASARDGGAVAQVEPQQMAGSPPAEGGAAGEGRDIPA